MILRSAVLVLFLLFPLTFSAEVEGFDSLRGLLHTTLVGNRLDWDGRCLVFALGIGTLRSLYPLLVPDAWDFAVIVLAWLAAGL